MDVQTENVDPPPCESQPSGKIRKGFKLFGKHKPGNIFSIRSKGDGNNKSPVSRRKTVDGLSETAAPDSEQDPDKEKGQEVSLAEREQAEEEPLGEDGVLAAAPARTSISSASSAKSLSFLSLLRGGRRAVGDRRVHTVSQPVGRQRRGLKGLFNTVRFRSKDKDDKEEAPPSPLLMSSRANSVEIIKEDLTLTPKSQPRSLDSPDTEPGKSLTAQDSPATSPSKTMSPEVATDNVSKTNEHVLPGSELPLVPGDTSLSSLLADISSLLTFDSITGGGDFMADVEAEWGKASSALSSAVPEVTPPSTSPPCKPTLSSPVRLPQAATPTTASSHYFTPLTKTTSSFSPAAKPSSSIATLTQPAPPVKLSSDSTPASEPTSIKLKPAPTTTHVALTSPSPAVTSSPALTTKSAPSFASATTAAPPNTPATVVKAPSASLTLTSTAGKLASEIAAPAQVIASVSKPSTVAAPTPASAKPPPVIHSPPTPAPLTQIAPSKLEAASSLQTSYKPSLSSAPGETKAPATVRPCTEITTPFAPEPVFPSKMTTATTSSTTSVSESVVHPKSTLTSTKIDVNKPPPSLVTVPSSTPTTTTKTQPSPPSVPVPTLAPLDKIPSMTKPTPAPVALDKIPPAPVPTSRTDISPLPPDLGQIPVSQIKGPCPPAQIPVSGLKDSSAPAQVHVYQSKAPPAPAQIPVSVTKDLPVPHQISVSLSKEPSAPSAAPCPVTSLPSTSPWSMKGSGQASVDGQLTSPSSTDTHGAPAVSYKTEKTQSESRTSVQGSSREKKTQHIKASGLSKIPVVGGGRGGKLPVRDTQPADDEASSVPPSPVLQEDRPPFNSHDAEKKDKISDAGVNVATSKDTQEESQPPPQPKVLTSLPRDSKIPVKHGTQIPQAKEAQRSKIPVSKVPVRSGNKPVAPGGSSQIRK